MYVIGVVIGKKYDIPSFLEVVVFFHFQPEIDFRNFDSSGNQIWLISFRILTFGILEFRILTFGILTYGILVFGGWNSGFWTVPNQNDYISTVKKQNDVTHKTQIFQETQKTNTLCKKTRGEFQKNPKFV